MALLLESVAPRSLRIRSRFALVFAFVVVLAAVVDVEPGVAARASGCDQPLTYGVVRVDPGHHMSRSAFVALLERSERLWETPAHKNLLRYQPGGRVQVSLIYDDLQRLYDKVTAVDAAIARMRPALERQQRTIVAEEAQYKTRHAQLAARIDYWNRRGGAPKALYTKLQTEQTALHQLAATLEAELRRANASIAQFNAAVSTRNRLVSARNSKRELGSAQLGGTKVSIAVLHGNAEDEVVIAHEFGHIFGIDHIRGPENIMNPVFVKPLRHASPADLHALATACDNR